MWHRFLVPLDGTAGGEAALAKVGELAQAEGATLRLLHVAPRREALLVEGRVVAYADQMGALAAERVRAYLMRAATRLAGLDVELAVRFGDPAEEILSEAESARVDLIAMATHRRSGLRRVLAGSVAEQVARVSKVPVFLVTHGASDHRMIRAQPWPGMARPSSPRSRPASRPRACA